MKYKKIILPFIIILLFISSFAIAQKKKKKGAEPAVDTTTIKKDVSIPAQAPSSATIEAKSGRGTIDTERMNTLMKMYSLGFHYYDLSVSQMALYEMIAMDLSNVSLRDSLALLYYNTGKYGSAIAVASDVIAVEKNNLAMLEVRALSNENLQFYNEALNDFEKLYLLSPNPHLLYKMATLQLTTKKNEQCKTNVEILLSDKEIDSLKIESPLNQIQQQQVPMRAAVLNLRGLLNKQIGNKAVAQQSFTDALKIEPNYKAAKANLEALNKPATK